MAGSCPLNVSTASAVPSPSSSGRTTIAALPFCPFDVVARVGRRQKTQQKHRGHGRGVQQVQVGAVRLPGLHVAVLLERIAYRPLRGAPRLVPLITAIGASFFLQYTFRGLFGTQTRAYPEIDLIRGSFTLFGNFQIQNIQVIVIVAASLMMAFLAFFVQYTKTGKAMRAVSEDKSVAALMGIDVDAIIVRTFALGAALAGAAGVLYCFMFRIVTFYMGFIPGIKAFTAAVLGGIGNPAGAMLGGLFAQASLLAVWAGWGQQPITVRAPLAIGSPQRMTRSAV